MITGAQCRAARALVEWTREKLSGNSGVDALIIEEFERGSAFPTRMSAARCRPRLKTQAPFSLPRTATVSAFV
ncbi:transcriptional regulator [Mesorhizobium sp. M0203]|uniref:transcriptional regulator n=1 Tax=Mesorhizobium sp. M0203 TaxID=2956912 RepID=UPI00333C7593